MQQNFAASNSLVAYIEFPGNERRRMQTSLARLLLIYFASGQTTLIFESWLFLCVLQFCEVKTVVSTFMKSEH